MTSFPVLIAHAGELDLKMRCVRDEGAVHDEEWEDSPLFIARAGKLGPEMKCA